MLNQGNTDACSMCYVRMLCSTIYVYYISTVYTLICYSALVPLPVSKILKCWICVHSAGQLIFSLPLYQFIPFQFTKLIFRQSENGVANTNKSLKRSWHISRARKKNLVNNFRPKNLLLSQRDSVWFDCRHRHRYHCQHSHMVVIYRVPETEEKKRKWKMFLK